MYKALIKADLKIVEDNYNSNSKALRLQAAYHMQQAVEKTIKLKARIAGLELWGHDIDLLLRNCEEKGVDVGIPKYLKDRTDVITHWEAECRYLPIAVVRRDTIKKVYDITKRWLG